MTEQLPVLQIIVPLLAAPICILLRKSSLCWAWATAVGLFCIYNSYQLLQLALEHKLIIYSMGNWAAPIGIEYRIDPLNALVMFVVSCISGIVLIYARKSIEQELNEGIHTFFYAAYLLCLTGLLGMTITGDAFNVFVFLEISSLSTYTLIALGQDRRAVTASYRYLVMGTIGATFILIGIGLLYMVTGTLNMADIHHHLKELEPTRTIQAAFGFLTVGFGLKTALFPMHRWLPNAYTYAPSAVSAFIAGTATKVAFYLLLRFFFTIFGVEFTFDVMNLQKLLLPLSVIAIVWASTVAIYKINVKRLLAYSSIAQMGYMLLAISLCTHDGLTAGLLHIFNHAMMKGALFLAVGCMLYRVKNPNLSSLAGIGKYMPWTFAAFIISGLSLVGVPLTVGFVSKWYLIKAVLERGNDSPVWILLAVLLLITSLLALSYVWKVIEVGFFNKPPENHQKIKEAPLGMLIPTWILVIANIYLGIQSEFTVSTASAAAQFILGGGP